MKIGGLQKTSLLDYPDAIAAIVWTVGCNFCCPFCYNIKLVKGNSDLIDEETVISFLKERKGLLEALSISGGEPLLQDDIIEFTKKIKDLGYKVKIDTNGTKPNKLKELLDKKLVDYVSMDIKAPKEKYNKLTGVKTDIGKIEESINIIKDKAPKYEFKTTVIPNYLDIKDIKKIGEWLESAEQFYLQQFKNDTSLVSSSLQEVKPYSREEIEKMLDEIKNCFKNCGIRGI